MQVLRSLVTAVHVSLRSQIRRGSRKLPSDVWCGHFKTGLKQQGLNVWICVLVGGLVRLWARDRLCNRIRIFVVDKNYMVKRKVEGTVSRWL